MGVHGLVEKVFEALSDQLDLEYARRVTMDNGDQLLKRVLRAVLLSPRQSRPSPCRRAWRVPTCLDKVAAFLPTRAPRKKPPIPRSGGAQSMR
jgi:hypothetical protein